MWSTTAADDWEHALISGNGRQGALCYGGGPGDPGTVRVTLSHERLFLPVDEPLPAPPTAQLLPELRAAVLAGDGQRAAQAVVDAAVRDDPRYARLRRIDPLVGAGTLTVSGLPGDPGGGYRRGTDYGTGVVRQAWPGIVQELFVSRADDVVVLRLRRSPGPDSPTPTPGTAVLTLAPLADPPPVPVELSARRGAGRLELTGRFPGAWPGAVRGFTVTAQVYVDGISPPGDSGDSADGLAVTWHRELLVLLRTTVDTPAPSAARSGAPARLADLPADWDQLLAAHERLHRPLIDACHLRLTDPPEPRVPVAAPLGTAKPAESGACPSSEELLAAPGSPALVEALFAASRYAIVSSTGELPPTLQGVWSGSYRPAWESGYTLDGNLFTALSGLAPTGTPQLLLPLFDLLDAHREDFRENARRLYGAAGVLLPPHLSTHGRHNHFDATWCLTFWTAGAAWAARLYAEYAEHAWEEAAGDTGFWSERALPFLRAVRDFERDFAPDGTFAPGYSPENAPAGTGSRAVPSQAAVNATLDVAAARALRSALGEPDDGLPGYTVAADGTLDEWLWPGLAPNHAHRHASHLFPVWYPDPALLGDPVLRAAAAATVRARLAWWRGNGDEMAFGLAGLGLAAAQLGMAAECAEILTLLSGYWRPSLVATHNRGEIFNVDICGGLPAMVVRMLVRTEPPGSVGEQPADLRLDLLPALPPEWRTGELVGAGVGRVRVPRLWWTPDRLEVSLLAREATVVELRAPEVFHDPGRIELPAGIVVDVCLVNRKTKSHAVPPPAGCP